MAENKKALSFGTDGVRAKDGRELEEAAYALGRASEGEVVLGRDTRASGEKLAGIFARGACDAGAKVTYVGIMPTAGVAYLTKSRGQDFGAVISASHNPPEYNGIKIFSSDGGKLSEKAENEFDAALRMHFEQKSLPFKVKSDFEGAREEYISFLSSCGRDLAGMKIALDCSCGAASVIAPEVFSRLNADVLVVSAETDGERINENCGALHVKTLKKRCPGEFDLYFAFDGDADRLMALDERGEVMDGDRIMYTIAALTIQNGGKVPVIVGTVMSNGGTEKALKEAGVEFLRAKVGDKYVKRMMDECGAEIGGEQSGHIILSKFAQTGDGILTAVVLASLLKGAKKRAGEFSYPLFPQFNAGVLTEEKGRAELPQVRAAVKKWEERGVRVLVRPSGTEPKIRIMTECENAALAQAALKEIQEELSR